MLWESLARVCVGEGGGGTSIVGVCKPLLHVYVCGRVMGGQVLWECVNHSSMCVCGGGEVLWECVNYSNMCVCGGGGGVVGVCEPL